MEQLVKICDVCSSNKRKKHKQIALNKCSICGVDLCADCSCTSDITFCDVILYELNLCSNCSNQVTEVENSYEEGTDDKGFKEEVVKPLKDEFKKADMIGVLKKILTLQALKPKNKNEDV